MNCAKQKLNFTSSGIMYYTQVEFKQNAYFIKCTYMFTTNFQPSVDYLFHNQIQ